MIRLEMKNYDMDINREAAKISAFISGKIDKQEYLTGEEILPSNRNQTIEQAKFAFCPLGKVLEEQEEKIVGAFSPQTFLMKKIIKSN